MTLGKIIEVRDQGTVVQVIVEDDKGRVRAVNFDHRPFAHFAASVGQENVIGTRVRVGTTDDGQEFVEVVYQDEYDRREDLRRALRSQVRS